jgi:dihydroorotase
MASYDLIVRNADIINHAGRGIADIGIKNGRFSAFGDLSGFDAERIFDASGLLAMPGVIDTQVHFREPGLEWKEDLHTGGRSAVLGGVVAVFEMPNTKPNTVTSHDVVDKLKRAQGRMDCDHAFFVGATHENIQILPELERLEGVCGTKVFMGASTGSLLIADDAGVEAVLRASQRRVTFHSEDEYRLEERRGLAIEGDWTSHETVRDAASAIQSTIRLLGLARRCAKRIHLLHVTTRDEIELLADYRDIATVEITPQHLTLTAPGAYEELKGYAQMNPPIRDSYHQMGLWRGIDQGIADVVGSDHAPHTIEEKQKPYPASPSGMPGVQTLLPVMLTHVAHGRLSLERLVDLTSAGAQRVFQVANKGRMTVGYDADLTLVDLQARRVIRHEDMASRCGWTPFDGFEAQGWPMATIIRGHIVMRDGEVLNPALGEPCRFMDTLRA